MEKDEPQGPRRDDPPPRDRARGDTAPGEPGRHRDPTPPRSDEKPRARGEKEKSSAWEAAEKKRRTALIVRLVLGLTLLVLFVVFVTQNSDEVPVHFVFTETRTPLAWVFLVCALIGGLVAYLLGRQGRRSSRKYIKELEKRLEDRGDKR